MRDITQQQALGSDRTGRTQEVNGFRTRNFVDGQQGMEVTDDSFKMFFGNLIIDSTVPKITMSDGNNTRLFIGNDA